MKMITKLMTNGEVYQLAVNLMNAGFDDNKTYIPAAVNFAIQKNKANLLEIAEEIEKNRITIIEHYSAEYNEEGYTIPKENIDKANNELKDLLSIEQEMKLYTFGIDSLGDMQLTSAQMQAIIFMIEE